MEKSFTSATAITIIQPQTTLSSEDEVDRHYPCSKARLELDKAMTAAASGLPTPTFGEKNDIRVVSILEYKEVALTLAEAFEMDQVSRYFIDVPDRADATKEEKWDLHVQICEYMVYAHILKGLVTATGPGYAAVALWMPPGASNDDWMTMLRSGMWRLRYKLSSEGRKRFFTEFMPLLHDTKAATLGPLDEESWYLVYVGTRPTGRGKGYARKLIEHISHLCDEEGRVMYLESSNPINPIIYRKLGFEDRRRVYLQRAEKAVELDIMVRRPLETPPTKVKIHRF